MKFLPNTISERFSRFSRFELGMRRFQEGMKKAYGKPTAVAAFIKRGQTFILAEVDKEHIDTAKEALKRASAKLPSPSRIVVKEN